MNSLQVKIICENSIFLPKKGSKEAAGYDLVCNLFNLEQVSIYPLETVLLDAGFSMELQNGYHAKIVSRSGLAKKGLIVTNAPGIIDSDYRGAVRVLLTNISKEPIIIENKTRIAQMLIEKHEEANFIQVTNLSETERAAGGFGSTGTNV